MNKLILSRPDIIIHNILPYCTYSQIIYIQRISKEMKFMSDYFWKFYVRRFSIKYMIDTPIDIVHIIKFIHGEYFPKEIEFNIISNIKKDYILYKKEILQKNELL